MAPLRRYDTIGDLLHEMQSRRLASGKPGGPPRFTQIDVAQRANLGQGHVSHLERGKRDLGNLDGDTLFHFLSAYGFTRSEIGGIVQEFGFNTPPQLLDWGAGAPGKVMVLSEGSISQRMEPTLQEVDADHLLGHPPDSVRIRTISHHDLATPAAQAEAKVGTRLYLLQHRRPREGSLVVVEQDEQQALVRWPLMEPTYAVPYVTGGAFPAILLDPKRIVVISVSMGGFTPHVY